MRHYSTDFRPVSDLPALVAWLRESADFAARRYGRGDGPTLAVDRARARVYEDAAHLRADAPTFDQVSQIDRAERIALDILPIYAPAVITC